MPPFLQFRLWLREGPRAERVTAALATVIVVAVAIAALLPVTSGGSGPALVGEQPVATAGGAVPSAAPGTTARAGGRTAATTPGTGVAPGTGTVPGAAPGTSTGTTTTGGSSTTSATASSDECAARTASADGITETEVHLDMANVSLAGPVGNSAFNVRPDLSKIAAALVADVNAHGGVACGRKVVIKQYDVNPLDSNDSHAKCLQMAADHPFLVVNFGAYLTPAARQCLVQSKVLQEAGTQVDQHELQTSFPYMFSPVAVAEQAADVAISGLAKRGFFSGPKFKKLGLLEDSCDPPVNQRIDADLARVGVPASKVSKYTLECNISSPPNQIEQGVLQHKAAGATHVLLLSSETNGQNYVRIASGQRFQPQYLVSDYGSNTSGSGTSNWGAPFDGAVAVTTSRVGEFSSGIHNAQEVECDKVLRRHGVNGIRSEGKDTSAMDYCDAVWFIWQALNHAGANPTQTSFLQNMGTMGLFRSVQIGDGQFDRQGKLTGGDFARALVYRNSCGCWKIMDRTMSPIG